ncbi:hypothetical protein [Jeotgalibacillus haloalkalitolerans]|uniref:hypothetical protein n=1 Tax=Jeotgalibacillus haloalkalitolerans TaxID=3104292 RepID=UPI002ACBF6B2|nr:hypothetical protein [Jeotgalibacillus sp. HH7-29]
MDFFSDNELGKKELNSEEINFNVFNAIVGIFNRYELCFCKHFPMYNDRRQIIGTDRKTLIADIKGYIPSFEEFGQFEEWNFPNKYSVLDFVQYCYSKISDVYYDETDFFGRDTYITMSTNEKKEAFRKEVNQIFERNQIVFYVDENGNIKRQLPIEMGNLINDLPVKTNDDNLNELIKLAIDNIHKPEIEKRTFALEKIWDAYERMKTYYEGMNKRNSANTLIEEVARGTNNFDEVLEAEFRSLTDIGNKFQIRHFERGKIKVNDKKHVDYLFFRMIALISLCLNELNT